ERRYPAFDGLNLTWESLEGIVKHNGPLMDRDGKPLGPYAAHGLPIGITNYNASHDLELSSYASLEAQVAAISDDIAYNAHDIDDGLRAGLFTIADLNAIPLIADLNGRIVSRFPGIDEARHGAELVRELISYWIESAFSETMRRIAGAAPQTVENVRHADGPLVAFNPKARAAEQAIKAFLWEHMYRHERVVRVMTEAEGVVADLFERYSRHPDDLPADWAHGDVDGDEEAARRIGNFIAGMTDRYAITEHQRLFDSTLELR
ncbi:MAG: deoxyguanosinetriphosphate triphosphohydrolase, partial [Bradyrhizobiaceae bacterium]